MRIIQRSIIFENNTLKMTVHTNIAESCGEMLERTKLGVFHYMSKKHLSRYLSKIGFRCDY